LNHFVKKKKIYYKVLWDDGSTTEEPRDMLYKDVPQLIDDFEEAEKEYKKGKKIRLKKTGSGGSKSISGSNIMNRDDYLEAARTAAKENDYDPSLLQHATDGVHKLVYDRVPFGRKGYKDRILYAYLEKNNKVPEGTTEKKYKNYRKRARAVMLKTKNKYSPASLAYYILW
jgi:hypothetical protein